MAELGDFLGGQPTTSFQTPGASDPGFQERKQGWLQSLKEMVSDPVTAMTLIQMGNSLSNPQPGASTGGIISGALTDALQYRGRYEQALRDQEKEKREQEIEKQRQAREDRRVDLEDRRAGVAEEELQARRQERMDTQAFRREQLGVERERLGVERMRARQAGGAGDRSTAEERMVAALRQANPGMSLEEALSRIAQAKDPKDQQKEMYNYALALWEARSKQSLPGEPLPDFWQTLEEVRGELGRAEERRFRGDAERQGVKILGESSDNPVEVTSPEDLRQLPKGTWVKAPDGRVWAL